MSSYAATIPVEFPYPARTVYEALIDLGRYPQWSSGLTSISHTGRMTEGLEYVTTSTVLDHVNRAEIKVVKLVPDHLITLESKAGLITFKASFEITSVRPQHCTVTCHLSFEFSNLIFNLARPAVESLTQARIRGDLEALRDSLR